MRNLNRRTLIAWIAVLALMQVGILAYLWLLLRPPTPTLTPPLSPSPTLPLSHTPPPPLSPSPTPPLPLSLSPSLIPAASYTALARAFDEEEALEHIAYLASRELGGRMPGSAEGRAAGDYIAARFAEYGLQPAGEQDSYFQTFTVPYGRITALPTLIITPAGATARVAPTYRYRTDYRALAGVNGYIGAGHSVGAVVWLNECLHDDYTGLDMVGKIALCRYTRDPEVYRQAIEHQVGGMLLVERGREDTQFRRGGYRETAWVPQTIPAYLITEAVAEDLLAGSGYTLDELSLRFAATPLSVTVGMAVTVEEQERVEARNVLALLPGVDPLHQDEIVVVGAHYDHLGHEPDGAVMHGANDNASGVAAVLEIARLWQAQGFRPARSVLFAAWDGEEQGLLGSRYYVAHPILPLTRTVALVNLDMVGGGETLQVDGEGDLLAQFQASAALYGITCTLTFGGGSDHVSFREAGVPAVAPAYWPDPFYHSPADTVTEIEPGKLKAVGTLAAHTLAALAEGHVELEQAVARMEMAILTGDHEAFLAGLDPADPDLRAAQAAWLDNLRSRELEELSIEPGQMRIGDGEAEVALRLSYRWAGQTRSEQPVFYDAHFTVRDGVWTFAGYELETLAGELVAVARFPDVRVEARTLLSETERAYHAIAADLGLTPSAGTRVVYYPDAATLRAIARPAATRDLRWLVPSAGLAEIAYGAPITPALVNLALTQMGLPPGEGAWLREGLALRYAGDAARQFLPALVASDVPTSLLDFPALDDPPIAVQARAWSAAGYLLDRYGAAGLRDLCAAWGRGGAETAFYQALGLSPAAFESAWQAAVLAPLRADAAAIQTTLAARAQAVLSGDEAGFLAAVAAADPVLRTEEQHWFADLARRPIVTYSVGGEIVGWSPGGDEAIVALNVRSTISGELPSQIAYDARFVRDGARWLYADVAWHALAGEHFILKHQAHDEAWARRTLDLAEMAYAQVTADLSLTPQLPVEIKLYDDGPTMHRLITPSLPDWVTGWHESGESLKIWLRNPEAIQRIIAHELTHRILFEHGVESAWLHEGTATFESDRMRPLGVHWGAGQRAALVQDAVRQHEELPVWDLPSFEQLPRDEIELAYAQSWSLAAYVVEKYGLDGLRRLIANPTDLRAALGVAPDVFLAEWSDYTRVAGVPQELVALAQRFDAERALAHVARLSSREFGGREAGTPGAEQAAAYIAGQFALIGLRPPDIPPTATIFITYQDFLYPFPISHTHLISLPALALRREDGVMIHEFTYRQDFIETGGAGVVQGELVWLHTDDLEGIYFGGAVALERDVEDPLARAAQLAEHGASGLIVITHRQASDFQTNRPYSVSGPEVGIPVFEMTQAAFEAMLERLGLKQRDLSFAPPALPLGVLAEQTLVRTPVAATSTANVLGLLPGSDPELADEYIIIGAHYDHVGELPAGGGYFPGANRNASGMGALLELARLWKAAGYQPARSVLFVAWGAEEQGSVGAAHYLAHPAVPLTCTVGVIALDSIGNGRGYRLLYYGTQENDLPLVYRVEAGTAALSRRAQRQVGVGEGWHALFHAAGIPTVELTWEGAERDFYLPDDTADRIDPERLAFSGEILALTAAWLTSR